MDGAATGIVEEGSVADLGNLEKWWNNPEIAVWSLVLFGCFLLNATLLLAFLVRPGLRTISNRFVMNLTVSNLLTCTTLNSLLMMDGPMTENMLTTSVPMRDDVTPTFATSASVAASNICMISEGATALVTTSSILSVLLIAVDQYFAVVDPLRYRARIDKFKSAVLIVSVWLVSVGFCLIAALNPNPSSLWLSCTTTTTTTTTTITTTTTTTICTTATLPDDSLTAEASAMYAASAVFENHTSEEEVEDATSTLLESMKIDRDIGLLENSTVIFPSLVNDSVTYGLIYAIVHSVFAYLLPFAGICWIYISIYSAAHRNSERTRRTGSRPILSSASFCDDPYGYARPQQQSADVFPEEFRRIPKISSLSSIDETSETAHSANQTSRRRSFSASSDATQSRSCDKKTSSGVVFTVGVQSAEVLPSCDPDSDNNLTEAADLKAGYLEDDRRVSYDDIVRSKFHNLRTNRRRRRSSCDFTDEAEVPSGWIAGDSSCSESEDERRYVYFDSLEVPTIATRKIARQRSYDYILSFAGCKTMEETRGDARIPTQDSSDIHRVDEEEDPIRIEITEREVEISSEITNSNVESKRWRRPCRRLSNISDGEARAIGGRSGENIGNDNNNLEPSICLLATPIVTITPAPGKSDTLHRVASVRSTSSYINSLKHRISNGSLFKYREETRAARISALVIVMGLICWSPYVLLNVIKNLPQYSNYEFPHGYDVLALSFLILAAYASPLLFGYRSRRVKRELRKFFCFHRELSYKNNRSLMAKKVLKRRHSSTLSQLEMDHRYNVFNCVYGRSKWPKEKVQFVQVPDTALAVETCRSSFSSGASTQISSTSTEEC